MCLLFDSCKRIRTTFARNESYLVGALAFSPRDSLRNPNPQLHAQGANPYPAPADPGGVVNISERTSNGIENKPGQPQKPPAGEYQVVPPTTIRGRTGGYEDGTTDYRLLTSAEFIGV